MNILLLTGTINPSQKLENKSAQDLNSAVRIKSYIKALSYYITQSNFDGIVFCENSGSLPSEFENMKSIALAFDKKIEILSFKGDISLPQIYGYGCGEAEIFDYVWENSKLLRECDSFYKITGRYILRDVNKKLDALEDISNYFHKQGLFMTQFTSSTAFFKISKINYKNYLYKKQIAFYKLLYTQSYKKDFFFKNHFPLERVWYLLLRQELLKYKQKVSFAVIYDYPKVVTHGFNEIFRDCIYRIYCALRLNQYGCIHKLLDMLFFEKTYKKLIHDVLSHLG